jgi:hypothetical protein
VDGRVKPGHDEDNVAAVDDHTSPHQFLHRAFQPLDRQRKHAVREQPTEMLRERDPRKLIPPLHGALLRNEQDAHLFERLAFLSRRDV